MITETKHWIARLGIGSNLANYSEIKAVEGFCKLLLEYHLLLAFKKGYNTYVNDDLSPEQVRQFLDQVVVDESSIYDHLLSEKKGGAASLSFISKAIQDLMVDFPKLNEHHDKITGVIRALVNCSKSGESMIQFTLNTLQKENPHYTINIGLHLPSPEVISISLWIFET